MVKEKLNLVWVSHMKVNFKTIKLQEKVSRNLITEQLKEHSLMV